MPDTDSTPTRTDSRTGLDLLDAYWRAANYLSVGQIYLLDNPLLREPLTAEHVKPRLLGHWGTTPGLNLLYAHMNRVINERGLDVLYVTGPGHGGPALVANAYLEGTYSEFYSAVSRDLDGMRALFRQFSFPGGIPSHVAPETPGSIHEGGELGYALVHAFGAAFDNPDLVVLCVVGDGEAETGPLAASWHSNKFLNPVTDGAVLPVLHLNGYKIASPTVLARVADDELAALMRGYGYEPHFVVGDDPAAVHLQLAATLDEVLDDIAVIQGDARDARTESPPAHRRWPMIVLRTPKGWTIGPKAVDGRFRVNRAHSRDHRQRRPPDRERGTLAARKRSVAQRSQRRPPFVTTASDVSSPIDVVLSHAPVDELVTGPEAQPIGDDKEHNCASGLEPSGGVAGYEYRNEQERQSEGHDDADNEPGGAGLAARRQALERI